MVNSSAFLPLDRDLVELFQGETKSEKKKERETENQGRHGEFLREPAPTSRFSGIIRDYRDICRESERQRNREEQNSHSS